MYSGKDKIGLLKTIILLVFSILSFTSSSLSTLAQTAPTEVSRVVAWSLDSKTLAVGGTFGIKVYSNTLQPIALHHSITTDTAWLAWSPDATRIASANIDHSVTIWDIPNGTAVKTLQGHTDEVRGISWSPDGKRIASGSLDQTVRVWDAKSGKLLSTLQSPNGVWAVVWSPDSSKLAAGGGHFGTTPSGFAQTWDMTLSQPTVQFSLPMPDSQPVIGLTWSPDSKMLAGSGSANQAPVWDAVTGKSLKGFQSVTDTVAISWGPDSTQLGIVDGQPRIVIWNPSTQNITQTLGAGSVEVPIASLAWSADGTLIASVAINNSLVTWDPKSGKQLASVYTVPLTAKNISNLELALDCVSDPQLTDTMFKQLEAYQFSAFQDSVNTAMSAGQISPQCAKDLTTMVNTIANIVTLPTPATLQTQLSICVKDNGLLTSLNARVDAQQWDALINEVEAQSGKKISEQCANNLIGIATFLLNNPPPTATSGVKS